MAAAESSVGVFTTDRSLVVRSWDAWLERVTGLARADACGRSLLDLYPELAARGHVRRLRRVVEDGAVEVLASAFHEYLIPCAPATPSSHFSRMRQHVVIAPLREGASIAGVEVTIHDVTARLDAERDIAAALASDDEASRRRAESLLASDPDAATTLAGALGDARWRVRRAAAEHLARGRGDAVSALVAALRERHRDPATLNAALAGLAASTEDVVPHLVALLAEPDDDVRTYAALALGQSSDARAVGPLLGALGDGNANVRQHAIEALGRIGAREAVDALAAIAETRDFFVAFAALDALGAIGEGAVAPRLLPLLDDPMLADAAIDALARLGAEEAIAPLARLLGDGGSDVARSALALATLRDRLEQRSRAGVLVEERVRTTIQPDGVRRLIAATERADDASLAPLARVLSWVDADDALAALGRLLAREPARHLAADALARRGPRAVDALLAALDGDDPEARKAAAASLGRVGSARAVPALVAALVAALGDESGVAIAAAGALGAIGDASAYEPLLVLFEHPDAPVRQAAVAALDSIGHPAMPERIRALLAHPTPHVRECAARVAGYFGYDECLEPMIALARDEDEEVRRAAVEHLVHFDDARAIAAVVDALANDARPAVRAAGARALAHADPSGALGPLVAALGDRDLWVRYHAARSLGAQRLAEAADALAVLALGDPVPPVRIAAIEALAALGSRAATLAACAADPDPEVAAAARAARSASVVPVRG